MNNNLNKDKFGEPIYQSQEEIKKEKKEDRSTIIKLFILGFVVIIIIYSKFSIENKSETNNSNTSIQTQQVEKPMPKNGQLITLKKDILAAQDSKTHDHLVNCILQKNNQEVSNLILQGKVKEFPANTKMTIKQIKFSTVILTDNSSKEWITIIENILN